ncbi:hypothetical protein [uncultured Pseudokineococcus sp.]|uniref:hypothetical protein n=1 Tax=uncultured Pseudokineococcus sp. TaxID=1642928 RepID=UPI00263555DA|nr:hypothetical protein [uncultured Pseudokineococcus sp.]
MDRPGDRWSPSPTALSAACIAGLALSAGVLVLLLPAVFQSGAQIHPLALVGLVVLSAAFAAGARYWRPRAPGQISADAD